MPNIDDARIYRIHEQTESREGVLDLEGLIYIHSVDGTGTIGVAGTIDASTIGRTIWITPMEVFGVTEDSKQGNYSEKTKQLLEIFKPGTIDFKILKARAELDAYEMANTAGDNSSVEYYYKHKDHMFVDVYSGYDGAAIFKSIIKMSKNS